jgi:hypothetical protein
VQRRDRYPGLATLTDQAMTALCAYGWSAGCKGAGGARRDNNVVGRREKSDTGDIERDHRTGCDAGEGRAGAAVPETAGCKIVMVFGRLSRRRGLARGRAGRHAKTKRILAEHAAQITIAGSGNQLQRGM